MQAHQQKTPLFLSRLIIKMPDEAELEKIMKRGPGNL